MALKINRVSLELVRARAEEVIESDFEQGRRRGIGGDVTADVVLHSIRAHHHRQGVPANQALDPSFEFLIAGTHRLLVARYGVCVWRVGRKRSWHSGCLSAGAEPLEDVARAFGAAVLKHRIERLDPLLDFVLFHVRRCCVRTVVHSFFFIPSCSMPPRYGRCKGRSPANLRRIEYTAECLARISRKIFPVQNPYVATGEKDRWWPVGGGKQTKPVNGTAKRAALATRPRPWSSKIDGRGRRAPAPARFHKVSC